MKRIAVHALLILFVCLAAWASSEQENPVSVSDDGTFFLKSLAARKGLCLVNTETGDEVVITENTGAGYYASISPDNQYVCFKLLQKDKVGAFKQTPALYDTMTGASPEFGRCTPNREQKRDTSCEVSP